MREPVNVKRGYPFGATPYPLRITNPDGTLFGWKHHGQDYPCPVGTKVVAPHSGKVTDSRYAGTAGNMVVIVSGNRRSRLLHNSRLRVSKGQTVTEGQHVADSGRTGLVTGPHVHWDLAINNKYVNPLSHLAPAPSPKMPPVGKSIRLSKGVNRTTFVAGTTKVAGTIRPKDNTYVYLVRGYDKKYPNRVLINSKSAGGNGVALALYYTNWRRIEGWTEIK